VAFGRGVDELQEFVRGMERRKLEILGFLALSMKNEKSECAERILSTLERSRG